MAYLALGSARGTGKKHISLADLFSVWRQRQHLKHLDAAALDDIGLSRAEADAEAARPFWDAPSNWTG